MGELNCCLERVEIRLYELLDDALARKAWDEARKVLALMEQAGII